VAVAVAGAHADRGEAEVDVAPAQREQLAHAEAGQCGGEEDRAVLVRLGRAHEREDLLKRIDVDVRATHDGLSVNVAHRVLAQSPDAAGALEDAVQQDEQLVDGAV
jgi:hypothetical protein